MYCKASVTNKYRLRHNFSVYASLGTCSKWKILKMFKEANETAKFVFPTNVWFLMWSTKWWCKEIGKKKIKQFCDKTSFWKFFVCTAGVISFTFILWKLSSYFLIWGRGDWKQKISVRGNLKDWQGAQFNPAYWKGRMKVLKMGCGGDLQ